MDIQAIAEKAADWWVEALAGRRIGSAGDGAIDMLLAVTTVTPKPDDVARFRESLVRVVLAQLSRTDTVYLSTDYAPNGLLAEVVRGCGLRGSFPVKTLMLVNRDGVTVSCGYRAPTVRVCGDAIWSAVLYTHDYRDRFMAFRGTVESEARSAYGAALSAMAAVGRGAAVLERDGYAVEERIA